jgi:hypothetical protein
MTDHFGLQLTPFAEQALAIYNSQLRALLEPVHIGEAVAIHVDSGDYAVGRTHSLAAKSLRVTHEPDGRVVTLTIGPPTESDHRLLSRLVPGTKA